MRGGVMFAWHVVGRLFAFLGVLVLMGVATTAMAGSQDASREKVAVVPVQDLLDPALTEQDEAMLAVIQKSFAAAGSMGGWDPSAGHEVAHISSGTVLLQALRHNLAIQVGQLDAAMAKQAIEEADAVFAPLFQISLGHSGSMVYERQRSGPVFLKQFLPTPTQGEPFLDINPPPPGRYQVDRIGYLQQKSSTVNKSYDLSKQQEPGWLGTGKGTLTIQQQLPWGPRLTLAKEATYKETYYDPNRAKSWDAPWAVSVQASLSTPLPYGKNFGPHSGFDTGLEQAKITDRQLDWTLKALINETLQRADLSYWDLVGAMENLLVAIQHVQYLEARFGHAERLLEHGRITQYGRDQMAVELARARVQEASARQSLVTASIALAQLIKGEVSSDLLLPVGYQQRLAGEVKPVNSREAVQTALARRPELQVHDLGVESSVLMRHYRENQARPDLLFSGSGSIQQSNAKYGYKSYPESLANVLNPDSRSVSGKLTYQYPWQNRAAKASLAQANYGVERAQLSRHALEQTVRQEVDDARIALVTAQARLSSSRTHEKLVAMGLKKAEDRWETKGDVGEMELLSQSQNLLNARLARILAMIDNQKAATRLATAQGILAEGLAEQTTVNGFDRQRLAALVASGATPHFAAAP